MTDRGRGVVAGRGRASASARGAPTERGSPAIESTFVAAEAQLLHPCEVLIAVVAEGFLFVVACRGGVAGGTYPDVSVNASDSPLFSASL